MWACEHVSPLSLKWLRKRCLRAVSDHQENTGSVQHALSAPSARLKGSMTAQAAPHGYAGASSVRECKLGSSHLIISRRQASSKSVVPMPLNSRLFQSAVATHQTGVRPALASACQHSIFVFRDSPMRRALRKRMETRGCPIPQVHHRRLATNAPHCCCRRCRRRRGRVGPLVGIPSGTSAKHNVC